MVLSDHVLIQEVFHLGGFRQGGLGLLLPLHVFHQYLVAGFNALVADVDVRPSDEFFHLVLGFVAEAAP